MKEQNMLIWREVNLRVFFDVQEAERSTLEYPGCPAGIDINRIEFEDDDGNKLETIKDVVEWLLSDNPDKLVDEAWEYLRDKGIKINRRY